MAVIWEARRGDILNATRHATSLLRDDSRKKHGKIHWETPLGGGTAGWRIWYAHISCLCALQALGEYSHNDYVLFHDADRPFLPKAALQRLVDALQTADAATLVLPVADSIVEVNGTAASLQYLDRNRLRRMQTPQAFRFGVLRAALKAQEADPAAREFTDTVSFALQHTPGLRIALVEGDEANFKITNPFDMVIAEAYAAQHYPQ